MRKGILAPWGAATLMTTAVLLWAPALVAGQAPSREESREAARAASPRTGEEAAEYFEAEFERRMAETIKRVYDPTTPPAANPPRTPWGDPDLRGYYLTANYTPLERPEGVTKALYTPQEAIEAFMHSATSDASVDPATVHYDWKEFGMDAWQSPVRPDRHTSLVVDPPDGRLPPLTPEAQQRRAAAGEARNTTPGSPDSFASVQTHPNLYTRCILGALAAPLVRGGQPGSDSAAGAGAVSTEMQIFQTPDHVVLVQQRATDVRIVPLDGRPGIPDTIRQWYGTSRGRWEGNTLVVETVNFSDWSPAVNPMGSTDAVEIVERFTVVDEETLRYEYTMTDPNTWTRPWTASVPLPKIAPPLYEFACHEQNYGVINVVKGAQITATTQGAF